MGLQGELDDEGGQASRVLLDGEGDAPLAAAEEGSRDELMVPPPRFGAREWRYEGGAGAEGGAAIEDLAFRCEYGEGTADGAEDAEDAGGPAAVASGGRDEGERRLLG